MLAGLAKESGSLYGLQWTNDNRIVVFGGGYPLKCQDMVYGAIGVSGGTVDEDMAVAKAALAVI